ncbi:MAG: EscU/YscU/HrcU family type III secretion system export apparatus switch protein, partial [Thermoguttaceae bacterium]
MADEQGEKSQEPTQHRRQQAREEGQVAKSHDLASAVELLAAMGILLMVGVGLVEYLAKNMRSHLGGPAWLTADVS